MLELVEKTESENRSLIEHTYILKYMIRKIIDQRFFLLANYEFCIKILINLNSYPIKHILLLELEELCTKIKTNSNVKFNIYKDKKFKY